jgi:hypothetical protein
MNHYIYMKLMWCLTNISSRTTVNFLLFSNIFNKKETKVVSLQQCLSNCGPQTTDGPRLSAGGFEKKVLQ